MENVNLKDINVEELRAELKKEGVNDRVLADASKSYAIKTGKYTFDTFNVAKIDASKTAFVYASFNDAKTGRRGGCITLGSAIGMKPIYATPEDATKAIRKSNSSDIFVLPGNERVSVQLDSDHAVALKQLVDAKVNITECKGFALKFNADGYATLEDAKAALIERTYYNVEIL
jgi:hypothetical protein